MILIENFGPQGYDLQIAFDGEVFADAEFSVEFERGDIKEYLFSCFNTDPPRRTHPANDRCFRLFGIAVGQVIISHAIILIPGTFAAKIRH